MNSMISLVVVLPFFSRSSYCRLVLLKLERNQLGDRMPSWWRMSVRTLGVAVAVRAMKGTLG